MANRIGKVTAPRLNLRRDPSMDHPPIVALPRGAEVQVLDQLGSWYKVVFADQVGYVGVAFLEVRDLVSSRGVPGPGSATTGFLASHPDLQRVPLQPAAQIPIHPGMGSTAHAAARTWNGFGGLVTAMSEVIEIPASAAISVLCVESGGAGFKGDRMIIRFENHIFFKYWGQSNPARFKQHFAYDQVEKWKGHKFRTDSVEPWTDFHGNQDREWTVFDFARQLDETAAMKSISMGASQIMGFNHRRIGYAAVQEMFTAFSDDVRFHILGMFDFIRSDGVMMEALKNHQFEQFATRYNGSGQAARYGSLIQQHCDACSELLPNPSTRIG